ncbi:MAG: hypothetical protein IPG90_12750 [Bacteroidetes bacterium]|nr:hypothetical protein [Bacteroidota bacterium]
MKNEVWSSDTLRTDGFEIYSDYKTKVSKIDYTGMKGKYFYPVYLVNHTPTTKVMIGKDSYVFAIQEALDTNHDWRPIEGSGFEFCGNGYWGLKIYPKEFLTFLIPKYGNTKRKSGSELKSETLSMFQSPLKVLLMKNNSITIKRTTTITNVF